MSLSTYSTKITSLGNSDVCKMAKKIHFRVTENRRPESSETNYKNERTCNNRNRCSLGKESTACQNHFTT